MRRVCGTHSLHPTTTTRPSRSTVRPAANSSPKDPRPTRWHRILVVRETPGAPNIFGGGSRLVGAELGEAVMSYGRCVMYTYSGNIQDLLKGPARASCQ